MVRLLLATLMVTLTGLTAAQDDRGPVGVSLPSTRGGAPGGALSSFGPPGIPQCHAGFSVRKAQRHSVQGNTRVFFQEVVLSLGGWSQFHGDFLAQCSGVYYFSFHAVSDRNSDFTMALMKNGQRQVTAYGSRRGHQQASNSVMLYLSRGDLVHLQLLSGKIYERSRNEAFTTFTGYLVQSL